MYFFANTMNAFDSYEYNFQTEYISLFSIKIFLSDHFISVRIYVFKLKQVHFLLEIYFSRKDLFSISWNLFDKSPLFFIKTLNVTRREKKYFECIIYVF